MRNTEIKLVGVLCVGFCWFLLFFFFFKKTHRRVSLQAKNTKNANKHCQAIKDSVLQKKSTVGVTGA